MPRRHPLRLPTIWLFTDARLGEQSPSLAAHLPPGSGIVVRDDQMPQGQRWRLVRRLARIAKARRLTLMLAATPDVARRWGADGVHLRQSVAGRSAQAKTLGLAVSMPVHNQREARTARRYGANLVFISPLHPTPSHPDGKTLSAARFARLARLSDAQPNALGGMNAARARRLKLQLAGSAATPGWAAIDAWACQADARRARQKRNCVPT